MSTTQHQTAAKSRWDLESRCIAEHNLQSSTPNLVKQCVVSIHQGLSCHSMCIEQEQPSFLQVIACEEG